MNWTEEVDRVIFAGNTTVKMAVSNAVDLSVRDIVVDVIGVPVEAQVRRGIDFEIENEITDILHENLS